MFYSNTVDYNKISIHTLTEYIEVISKQQQQQKINSVIISNKKRDSVFYKIR